eukprot:Skav235862  [mRNA]  locus=scaffold1693:323516:324286:- [translate_table: standard]
MPPETRSSWQAECCVEKNILRGSEREAMCESVLQKKTAIAFTQQDLPAKDMGIASYVGENEKLVWTAKGVSSILGPLGWAVEDDKVDDSFLRWQPLSVQEGLDNEYWKKVPEEQGQVKTKASFLQSWAGNSLCNLKTADTCTAAMQAWQKHSCLDGEGWHFLATVDDCDPWEIDPKPLQVQTAKECLDQRKSPKVPAVFAFAINQENPIDCFLFEEVHLEKCTEKVLSDLKDDALLLSGNTEDFDFEDGFFWKFPE